jgi:hypothetical protein
VRKVRAVAVRQPRGVANARHPLPREFVIFDYYLELFPIDGKTTATMNQIAPSISKNFIKSIIFNY